MSADTNSLPADFRALANAAVDQGWTAIARKKGILLRSPDGTNTTMLHRSVSDHRAYRNQLTALRRGGLVWPS